MISIDVERGAAPALGGSEMMQGQQPAVFLDGRRQSRQKTVRIGIQAQKDAGALKAPVSASGRDETLLSFGTIESFIKTLTLKRWQLVQKMQGAGPMSLRAAARRIARDVKGVHSDVHALLNAGLLVRNADGRIECPFDHIRVEFDVCAEGFGVLPAAADIA